MQEQELKIHVFVFGSLGQCLLHVIPCFRRQFSMLFLESIQLRFPFTNLLCGRLFSGYTFSGFSTFDFCSEHLGFWRVACSELDGLGVFTLGHQIIDAFVHLLR